MTGHDDRSGLAAARLLESNGYRVWSIPGSEALLCARLPESADRTPAAATDRARDGLEMLRAILDQGGASPPATVSADAGALAALTARQRQVLAGIVRGSASKVIAWQLGLSVRTIEAYRVGLFRRLGARNTAEAVRIALSAGFDGEGED